MNELTNDETRDLAIRITDKLVEDGYIKNCIDTDDTTEFSVQDIIHDEINNQQKNSLDGTLCRNGKEIDNCNCC